MSERPAKVSDLLDGKTSPPLGHRWRDRARLLPADEIDAWSAYSAADSTSVCAVSAKASLTLSIRQGAAHNGLWQRTCQRSNVQPGLEWNRAPDFMSDRGGNQNGSEESRKQVQSVNRRKRNQRTGIGDGGHSEQLAGIHLAA